VILKKGVAVDVPWIGQVAFRHQFQRAFAFRELSNQSHSRDTKPSRVAKIENGCRLKKNGWKNGWYVKDRFESRDKLDWIFRSEDRLIGPNEDHGRSFRAPRFRSACKWKGV